MGAKTRRRERGAEREDPVANVAAIILCGGESRRMGRPKAWLPLGGEALLQRVVRIASAATEPVVVVAAAGQTLPELAAPVVLTRDRLSGRGPLQGLAFGLDALPPTAEFVYATAVDAPFLEPAWIARLAELIGDFDVAAPRIDGRIHPLASLYRAQPTREAARRLLDEGVLRLTALVERLRARDVSAEELRLVDPELRALRNLNTPADYQRAARRFFKDDGKSATE